MHTYLPAVGFKNINSRKKIREILRDVVEHFDEKTTVEDYGDGLFTEFTRYYAKRCGISVCGVFEEDNTFHIDYYYPFFRGKKVTSSQPVTVQRHAEKDSFAGACDDYRIGVTLIFYLQNPAAYMKHHQEGGTEEKPLFLTGLAKEGTILLPLKKDQADVEAEKEQSRARGDLIAAAMDGDEEAMETLTVEDMDTYSMISERITTEDVFTIVDSYFMPNGNECDQYSLMGEILEVESVKNSLTGEDVFLMSLDCNDVVFEICINHQDLLGEPEIGRRFKGIIQLQGRLSDDVQ